MCEFSKHTWTSFLSQGEISDVPFSEFIVTFGDHALSLGNKWFVTFIDDCT